MVNITGRRIGAMGKLTLTASVLMACVAGLSDHANAQIVTNGGFGTAATETLTSNSTNNAIPNASPWYYNGNSSYGAGCLIGSDSLTNCGISFAANPGNSPVGTDFIAVDTYTTNTAGTVSQTIGALTAGAQYTLTFYIGQENENGETGSNPIKWTVDLGSTQLATETDSTAGWDSTPISLTFTATSAESGAALSFIANTTSSGPPIALLDGVSITPAPEPASMTLLGLGGLGLLGLHRRRRAAAVAVNGTAA